MGRKLGDPLPFGEGRAASPSNTKSPGRRPTSIPTTTTTTTTVLQPFFWEPGWGDARRELLDFMVRGKINRGRHTDHPAGCHSIRTNQCRPAPSPHFLQTRCPSCRPTNSVKALSPTPTSVPSGILIHTAIWPQQIWLKIVGGCSLWGWGAGSPSNTMWPGLRPRCMPSFISHSLTGTIWPILC